ncbi:unnamed protein product, partial [Rotaria magnacalcarata]
MELRHCNRLAVSLIRLSRQPTFSHCARNFSSSTRLYPKTSSQLIFKRSISWQFWKSSSTV